MTLAKNINSHFKALEKAQKAQLSAQYKQDKAAYKTQLARAPEQYQTLRNEAYVNHALLERARREQMANMGLSGVGGTAQTFEQRNTAQLKGTLGDVSRQQRDYTDQVNMALAGLGVQYNADLRTMTAQNAAQRNAALLEQARFEVQHNQKQQKSLFDQAYSLYEKGLITAAQFSAMTGINLKQSTPQKTSRPKQTAVPHRDSYNAR